MLRAVREERVRHELRAVRAPVGRVRRGLGDEHSVLLGDGVETTEAGWLQLQSYNTVYAEDFKDAVCGRPVSRDAVSNSFGLSVREASKPALEAENTQAHSVS